MARQKKTAVSRRSTVVYHSIGLGVRGRWRVSFGDIHTQRGWPGLAGLEALTRPRICLQVLILFHTYVGQSLVPAPTREKDDIERLPTDILWIRSDKRINGCKLMKRASELWGCDDLCDTRRWYLLIRLKAMRGGNEQARANIFGREVMVGGIRRRNNSLETVRWRPFLWASYDSHQIGDLGGGGKESYTNYESPSHMTTACLNTFTPFHNQTQEEL